MKQTAIENLLIASTVIVFGIMAGFFWTYTFNVNLAMNNVDGETYARVQSLFNQNVRHSMFFIFFFGGGFFPALALVGNKRHWKSWPFLFLALAFIVYVGGVIVFTAAVNLPLNAITEAWNPASVPADWADVRQQWNDANAIRVATSGSAFALSVLALLFKSTQAPLRTMHVKHQ